MSTYNMYRPNEGDLPSPEIVKGVITRVSVRQIDNQTTVEVLDDKGNTYSRVEVINQGSGDQTTFIRSPLKIGAEVLLLKLSPNSQPYVIGSTFTVPKYTVSNTPVVPTKNEDENSICTSDYTLENSGNRLSLNSYKRGIVLSANKDVRIQLGNEGVLRISHVGETEDYPVNGLDFINNLHAYLNELRRKEQKLEELQQQLITTIGTLNGAIQEFAASQSAVIAATPAFSPLAAAYTALASATVTDVGNDLVDCATINNDLNNLPLRANDQSKVECMNTVNTKVILPSGG